MQVIPAVLENTFGAVRDQVARIDSHADFIHLDVADGDFVPNTTWADAPKLDDLDTHAEFGVHLMISDPQGYAKKWIQPKVRLVTFHIEPYLEMERKVRDFAVFQTINVLKAADKKVGIAINPPTNLEFITPYIDKIDRVQIMTVNPGFQGSDFVESALEKVRELKDRYPQLKVAVDGGMNDSRAPLAKLAGADAIISGSFVMKSSDPPKALEDLIKTVS